MLDLIEDSKQINKVAPVKSEHSCLDRRVFGGCCFGVTAATGVLGGTIAIFLPRLEALFSFLAFLHFA